MLEMFEKLINEHGSSVILKERLELISDKYNLLEEKNKQLETRNQQLESELNEDKNEIKRLQALVSSHSEAESSSILQEIEVEILKYLFETNNSHYVTDIARKFNISTGHAEHYLDSLVEKDLIYASYSSFEATGYSIDTNGRKYIIENT